MSTFALAQINAVVGDLEGNARRMLAALAAAGRHEPDLVVFPELALTGYPPEDLLLKPAFLEGCERAFQDLARQIDRPALIGFPRVGEDGRLYNAAAWVAGGEVAGVYHKQRLPNYAVFDEMRYFSSGTGGFVAPAGDHQVGVIICEDAWSEGGPARDAAARGAQVVACLSASPYYQGKQTVRQEIFARLCRRNGVWFLYANLVGGQDALVFDGASWVMNPEGEVVARAKAFEEDLLVVELDGAQVRRVEGADPRPLDRTAEVYSALVLGVQDYVGKNGFPGVVLGLSGGIDSALTAAVAVDAVGAQHVTAAIMPSRYSSEETQADARAIARHLGVRQIELPIEGPHRAFEEELAPVFADVGGDPENLTDQNVQARIRAVLLMALSNKLGLLVLNTSNKSESAVGYGTLYGDMVGGFAVIQDVFKAQVWELARYVNDRAGREVLPARVLDRVPSAELRPDQEDRQALPDYSFLDPILELYIEQDSSFKEIVAAGHDAETVRTVLALVDRNEFKRRQAVMGVRVTAKAFGKDRRLPVTNRFRP